MGLSAFVPVEEAFDVDGVADVEATDCVVNVGGFVAEIVFNNEGVGVAADGCVEVEVAVGAFLTGTVPVVEERCFVAVCVGGRFHGQTVECNELVLVVDEFFGAEESGSVHSGCYIIAVEDFEGGVDDFNFACPCGLVAGNLDLGAGNELRIVFFGHGHVVAVSYHPKSRPFSYA